MDTLQKSVARLESDLADALGLNAKLSDRIAELESVINEAEIRASSAASSKVTFGGRIVIRLRGPTSTHILGSLC